MLLVLVWKGVPGVLCLTTLALSLALKLLTLTIGKNVFEKVEKINVI